MELTDDKLRQIVRETLRELGPHADPALVQKVVREVVRHLMQRGDLGIGAANLTQQRALNVFRSSDGTPDDPSRHGY